MSMFDEVNEDATSVSPDLAATGPRVGFLQSFEDSYNAQVRGSAMYGIEKAMHELDNEQVDAMRKAGIEDVPALSDDAFGFFGSGAFSGTYMDTARFYEDGGDPDVANRLKEYDTKIDTLRKTYPNLRLRTSRELWDEVRSTAQQYEQYTATNRNTFGGTVGGFLGGAVGGLNVESDPLNFATMPLAVGRTIAGRIGFQGAAQGATETINQLTGVQEQRRLLGLETGFADGLTRVAGAAIGGAVLQGAGEALGAGFRRFFRDAPHDPAPIGFEPSVREPVADASAVPRGAIPADPELAASKLVSEPASYMDYLQEVAPWSLNRLGKQRTVLDLDYTTRTLNDWTAETPADMKPLTLATQVTARSDFTAAQPNIFDRVAQRSTVDEVARQIDPETFRVYDKHADDKAKYLARIEEMRTSQQGTRNETAEAKIAELSNRIDDLNEKVNRSGAMKAKKITKEINALKAERDATRAELVKTDTPEMARMRMLAAKSDEKMRDLTPVVSRAYARARNKWDNTDADRQAVRTMIADGRKTIGEVDADTAFRQSVPLTLEDKAPILKARNTIQGKLPDNADAATVAQHIIAERAKTFDDATETFRSSLAKIISEQADETVTDISIPGQDYKLRLDEDVIVDDDGQQYTIRQFLTKHVETEEDLKAVTSCSIL